MHADNKDFLSAGWKEDWQEVAAHLLDGFSLAAFLEGEEDPELSWLQPVTINMEAVKPWAEKNAELNPANGYVLSSEQMMLPLDAGQAVYIGHMHATHEDCTHEDFLCLSDAEVWRDEETTFLAAVEMVHVIATQDRILFYLHHTCGQCEPFKDADDATKMDYIAFLMEVELRL
jgi:hypothetical protein